MNIVATMLPDFEEIVSNFIKIGKLNILDQLAKRLEEIDDELCSKRPKSLKIIKIKERTVLTEIGLLTFRRRYYYDTFKEKYLYLLDYHLKIPKRAKIMTNIKLKIIEAASEMSYSKAAKYGAPDGFPLSKSTAFRYLKNSLINIEENYFIKDNDAQIHVQIDEKFLNIKGFKNKKKYFTATIFKGIKPIGTKGKMKLENRTILSSSGQKELFEKINNSLIRKYKVSKDDKIFVSGDLARYIQYSPDKIWVCESIYVPDKYHIKSALLKEAGIIVSDKNLANKKYIKSLIDALKDTETVEGKKLLTLLKTKSKVLKEYQNPNYNGCSQEGMNSHYYASRFAKNPMSIGIKNLEKLSMIIEAIQNGSKIEIGFKHKYYFKPMDIIGHMWHFDENRMVLDTREMRLETKKMFEDIKYGW